MTEEIHQDPECPRCLARGGADCQVNGGHGCQGLLSGHSIHEDGTETPFYVRHDDKVIELRFTVPVEIRVPSDFPVTAAEMVRLADWHMNNWCDGRYPFSTEQMHHGAARWAQSVLYESIEHHYHQRVEKRFGQTNGHRRACDKLIARRTASLDQFPTHLVEGGKIEVSATTRGVDDERAASGTHVVICRDDRKEDGQKGDYALATRTVFESRAAAEAWAAGISSSREPLVVALPIAELRLGEDRGR